MNEKIWRAEKDGPALTVGSLRKLLAKYPADTPVYRGRGAVEPLVPMGVYPVEFPERTVLVVGKHFMEAR